LLLSRSPHMWHTAPHRPTPQNAPFTRPRLRSLDLERYCDIVPEEIVSKYLMTSLVGFAPQVATNYPTRVRTMAPFIQAIRTGTNRDALRGMLSGHARRNQKSRQGRESIAPNDIGNPILYESTSAQAIVGGLIHERE